MLSLSHKGHFKNDCQELKNKNKETNGDAATMEEEGYESVGVCVATKDLQRGKWILDSGCTFHMCLFKIYFSDYHDLNRGKVIMGNNAVCKVIGMGNVSLRLHDGKIWELREVRYVFDLKRNLISLGLIDQNGFSIKLESGKLLIMKGSKIVMKG